MTTLTRATVRAATYLAATLLAVAILTLTLAYAAGPSGLTAKVDGQGVEATANVVFGGAKKATVSLMCVETTTKLLFRTDGNYDGY
jgi:hypothetical protein